MVTTCAAYRCTERHIKGTKLSFHGFPSDPELREKWLANLKRPNFQPSKHSKICSKHFEPHCFDNTKFGHPGLLKGSVPTIFKYAEPQNLLEKNNKKCKSVSSLKTVKCIRNISDSFKDNVETYHSYSFTRTSECTETDPVPLKKLVDLCGSSSVPETIESPENICDPLENCSSSTSQTVESTDGTHKRKSKYYRYVGDYTVDDMKCPNKAEKYLSMTKRTILLQRKQLKVLHQKNRRLQKKIVSLKSLVAAHLQKKCLRNEKFPAAIQEQVMFHEQNPPQVVPVSMMLPAATATDTATQVSTPEPKKVFLVQSNAKVLSMLGVLNVSWMNDIIEPESAASVTSNTIPVTDMAFTDQYKSKRGRPKKGKYTPRPPPSTVSTIIPDDPIYLMESSEVDQKIDVQALEELVQTKEENDYLEQMMCVDPC